MSDELGSVHAVAAAESFNYRRDIPAGRTGEATGGVGSAARAGPLLALLILLWPSETAGPEHDHGPEWLPPEEELKAKLREVSEAAQQVRSELSATPRQAPPRSPKVDIHDKKAPRDAPCEHRGSGGPGPFQGGTAGWIRCSYVCGRYEVTLYDVWGSSTKDCDRWSHLKRAREQADSWARINDKER